MKIFVKVAGGNEKCNLDCDHRVDYYRVEEVTEVGVGEPYDVYYGAQFVSTGRRRWYADSSGVIYIRTPHWDGPDTVKNDLGESCYLRPSGAVCKDLDGNVLDMWGEVIEG